MRRQEQWDASYTSRKWAGSCLAKRTFRRNTGRPVHVPGSDAFAALKPCAMTYHSEESLRLAGGLACLTLWKLRFSAATRSLSAPPARPFPTTVPPSANTTEAHSTTHSPKTTVHKQT